MRLYGAQLFSSACIKGYITMCAVCFILCDASMKGAIVCPLITLMIADGRFYSVDVSCLRISHRSVVMIVFVTFMKNDFDVIESN